MVKHLFSFILVLVFLVPTVHAQILKGDLFFNTGASPRNSQLASPTSITSGVASISAFTESDFTLLLAAPTLGYVPIDGLLLGGQIFVIADLSDGGESEVLFTPFARYYVLNNEDIMAYGALSYQLGSEDFSPAFGNNDLRLAGGVSLPLGSNVLFSPELGYQIGEFKNSFDLNFQLEFLLGSNRSDGSKAVGYRGKGVWMFGTQLGGALFGTDETNGIAQISPDAYYFLNQNFAVGANVTYTSVSQRTFFGEISESQINFGVAGRYYFTAPKHTDFFVDLGLNLAGPNAELFGVGDELFFATDLAVGADIWLRDRVALELGLNWRSIFEEDGFNEIGLLVGGRFSLGGGIE
ncbi:MAG: hypothetical protein AAF741_14085 [Bacteroidota bacterium]